MQRTLFFDNATEKRDALMTAKILIDNYYTLKPHPNRDRIVKASIEDYGLALQTFGHREHLNIWTCIWETPIE